MEYLIISFTHKNTSIETREKLAFTNDLEKELFLKDILKNEAINEAILVSTCNRVEFILSVSDTINSSSFVLNLLSNRSNVMQDELEQRTDIYKNEDAIHHLFTVVSSLDSLVVGETQIAGQVKDAYKFSLKKEFCSIKLSRVLNYAFKCAAKVRQATSLGTGSVSVASTAVLKAKEIYKDVSDMIAIVIGAGEMSEIAIKHLLKSNFSVIICSRNSQKAKSLASSLEGDVIAQPYSKLKELLNSKRLLFTATSAPYPIITKDMIEDFSQERNWFDIAVPRDIQNLNIQNINIFSVDDLQGIINENINLREDAAIIAYRIVKDTTKEFFVWLKTLSVEPTIKKIYEKANIIIDKKLKIALKKSYISKDEEENVHKLCKGILQEFLHSSSTNLREVSNNIQCDDTIQIAQNIFGLSDD